VTTYLLDANVFIQAKNLHYGFEFCPAFWDWLDQENASGTVFSTDRVGDEIAVIDDELAKWAKKRAELFLPADVNMDKSLNVVSNWAQNQKYDPTGIATFFASVDHHLVAYAHAHGYVVVTHEVFSSSPNKIKIPNACRGIAVKCINPYEMLQAERALFVLGAL